MAFRPPREFSQYVAIRYAKRLVQAGIDPFVGSVGDSYENALTETVDGLYEAEVIHRRAHEKASKPSSSPPLNV
jgi:transposase InsO family protein